MPKSAQSYRGQTINQHLNLGYSKCSRFSFEPALHIFAHSKQRCRSKSAEHTITIMVFDHVIEFNILVPDV
jgi:hypothetical protein